MSQAAAIRYKVRQHRPGFIEVDEPPAETAVETVKELFALDWVKRWSESGEFDHWERNQTAVLGCFLNQRDHKHPDQLLCAVMRDGRSFVVAYVDPTFDLVC